jgi:hypothetical protein
MSIPRKLALANKIIDLLNISMGKPGGGGKPAPEPELVLVTVTGNISGSATYTEPSRGGIDEIPFTATLGGEIFPAGTYDGTLSMVPYKIKKQRTYHLYFEGPDFQVFVEASATAVVDGNSIVYSNCEAWNPAFGIPPKIIVNRTVTRTPQ